MLNSIRKNRFRIRLFIIILDIICIVLSGAFSLLVKFDFNFSELMLSYVHMWLKFLPIECCITIILFYVFKMYHFVWHSVGIFEIIRMVISICITFCICFVLERLIVGRMPLSTTFIKFFAELFLFVILRCFVRIASETSRRMEKSKDKSNNIMLVGAGAAGQMLIHEIESSTKSNGNIVCIIDDNPNKWGNYINGIKVQGGRRDIPYFCKKYNINQIILAMPAVELEQQNAILEICQKTGCKISRVPGIYQMLNGEVLLDSIKEVTMEDLLGRDSIQMSNSGIEFFLSDNTVLVTGGGGSIGSELCRQIAHYNPKMLIIVDIYENNAYDIQQELCQTYGNKLNIIVEIASVRDDLKINFLFEKYHPDIVFHAAAHKHVPLMEHNPEEAVKNNIFGTYNVVNAAEKYGTKKFVMISTDKAVNPTNFMGATKRFCEMILQSRFGSSTEFCCVRFGNVLGSNGSVVPLFKKQIEEGGPVTITDKRIIRYFMTIPEASRLVLEAGAMAKQGQIFVLDMGEPVKILDLAENLIRLSGLEPYKDIEIVEIGLRPGEKLYEELLISSNELLETANKKIFIEQQSEIPIEIINSALDKLKLAVMDHLPQDKMIDLLQEIIPTYKDPSVVNQLHSEIENVDNKKD